MDRAGAPQLETVTVTSDTLKVNPARPNTADKTHMNLCFSDEVMDHEFLEGFKPVNIESYDGTTDPAVWIEDFLLHIHMARGDDLHAIKFLPLKLKGPTRHWLNSLPANSVGS